MPLVLRKFRQRISDGIAIEDLWAQFRADALFGYQFYYKELDQQPPEGRIAMETLLADRTRLVLGADDQALAWPPGVASDGAAALSGYPDRLGWQADRYRVDEFLG
jgi:hypothetical protein